MKTKVPATNNADVDFLQEENEKSIFKVLINLYQGVDRHHTTLALAPKLLNELILF